MKIDSVKYKNHMTYNVFVTFRDRTYVCRSWILLDQPSEGSTFRNLKLKAARHAKKAIEQRIMIIKGQYSSWR